MKRLVHRRRGTEREHALGDSWLGGAGRADALGGAGRLDAGALLGGAWTRALCSAALGEAARQRLVGRALASAWRGGSALAGRAHARRCLETPVRRTAWAGEATRAALQERQRQQLLLAVWTPKMT